MPWNSKKLWKINVSWDNFRRFWIFWRRVEITHWKMVKVQFCMSSFGFLFLVYHPTTIDIVYLYDSTHNFAVFHLFTLHNKVQKYNFHSLMYYRLIEHHERLESLGMLFLKFQGFLLTFWHMASPCVERGQLKRSQVINCFEVCVKMLKDIKFGKSFRSSK